MIFADLDLTDLQQFHDHLVAHKPWPVLATLPDNPDSLPELWRWIYQNHHHNILLWEEEDQARRTGVADAAIAANKRAIDRYNQARNDAVEQVDTVLLSRFSHLTPHADAWHHSETAGAMIDRLSILSLKVYHMGLQANRAEATDHHRNQCREKLARLQAQRTDLAKCLNTLLQQATEGRTYWRIYRQFKMYNDPTLNPYLYAATGGAE